VVTWGRNSYGGLGNGTNIDSNLPVEVTGLINATAVTCGSGFSFAKKQDGSVWGWGYNYEGQMGNGTTTESHVPVELINLNDFVSIFAGWAHAGGIKADGSVWTWGHNGTGKLGTGGGANELSPVEISTFSDVNTFAPGGRHSMFLLSNGELYSSGMNDEGQCGVTIGTTFYLDPIMVTGTCSLEVTAVEEDETSNEALIIYPNPAENFLNLNWKLFTDKNISAKIYSSLNQVVKSDIEYNSAINISSLETGVYFLEIENNDQRYFKRFIKK
jgi:alpha-tubulin suppressor-like RCC1 family protein